MRKKTKKQKQRTDLSSTLTSMYEDIVNLKTTCNHCVKCCSVGCPSMHYCEFINIITDIWETWSKSEKIDLICSSIEYFFRFEYEKFGKDSLVKPCLLLDNKSNLCKLYEKRPLNCRLYGLWPSEIYETRVAKFVKAYEQYGLKKEDIPLSTQCPYVKRVDDSVPLDEKTINELFARLDKLDESVGSFSQLQTKNKENYRSFHDWVLFSIFGEEWLSLLTNFVLAATREQAEDQIKKLKESARIIFAKKVPNIKG